MWVRIDEMSFAADNSGEVINYVRNNAVSMHHGEGFRGFRLLVDRSHARALNVSYWDTEKGARADTDTGDQAMNPAEAAETTVVRSNVYELAIDAG